MTEENQSENFFAGFLERMHQRPDGQPPEKCCGYCKAQIEPYANFGVWMFEEDCGCGGHVKSRRQGILNLWEQRIVERVGKRHSRVRVPLHPAVQRVIDGAVDGQCCAYLWGSTGSGKTQQLIEAERYLQRRRVHAYSDHEFTVPHPQVFPPSVASQTEGQLLESLKPNAGPRQKSLAYYQDVACLCVDDLGTAKLTEWGYGQLFEIIDHRSRHEKVTLISSNVALNDLVSGHGYDDRFVMRLFEMCGGGLDSRPSIVEFKGNHRIGGER